MTNKFEEQTYQVNRQLRNHKLVIFIGSGVSINSGYPSWKSLAKDFSEFYLDEPLNLIDIDLLDVFENAFQEDHEKYFEELGRIFGRNEDDHDRNSQIIDLLLKMNPQHIITTNYDYLIEKSIKKFYYSFNKVVQDEDLIDSMNPRKYIKMHGDFEHKNNIVLKETDYSKFADTHPLIETFIKSILVDHSILFVGYSFKDRNLRSMFNWIDSRIRANNTQKVTHYFINSETKKLELHDKKTLLSRNIEVIEYVDLLKYSLFEEVDVPQEITDQRGKNLFTILYYLISNMSTVEGLKFILKDYEDISRMFPEDLIKYLNLNKFVRFSSNYIINNNYREATSNWVTKLFYRLDEELTLNYRNDIELQKINKIFRDSSISGFVDTSVEPYKYLHFFPEIVKGHNIILSYQTNDYIKLSSIRDSLEKQSNNDYFSLTQLMYLNKLFFKDNTALIDEALCLRDKYKSTGEFLKMFILSCNLDWLKITDKEHIFTSKILNNLSDFVRDQYKFAFGIVNDIDLHQIVLTRAFESSVFSSNTLYGIGFDPLEMSYGKVKNFVDFHNKNFLLSDFNNKTLKDFVRTYFASLLASLEIYNDSLEKEKENYPFSAFGQKKEPLISLNNIWMFSRYLSKSELSVALNKFQIDKINLIDGEQLQLRVENIINSFSKFPYNDYIRNHFLSYMYLFQYFKAEHNSIVSFPESVWDIFENEIRNPNHYSREIIRLLYFAIIKTSAFLNKGKLLTSINENIFNNQKGDDFLMPIVEEISRTVSRKDILDKEKFDNRISYFLDQFLSTKKNRFLSILLFQLHVIKISTRDKLIQKIIHAQNNDEYTPSLIDMYCLINSRLIPSFVYMEKIKRIYKESFEIVNSNRAMISYPDVYSDNIRIITFMVDNGLIDNFQND